MDVEIIIIPLKGVLFTGKEISFGMSQKDVENILGKPARYEVNNLIDLTCEPRYGTTFFYGTEGLESIDIPLQKSLKVYYEGIDILHDKESVMKLSEYDTPTADDGQFMNFYKLGICLGGYGRKRVPEKKLVTVFPESQKEAFISRYKTGGGRITHKIEKVKMWYERNME
jgi:hypothetical protein